MRLSGLPSFGQTHLSTLIMSFLSGHPGVRIELDMTDRPVDLLAEGYDVAVRIGNLVDSSLIARRLTSIDMVIYPPPPAFGACPGNERFAGRGPSALSSRGGRIENPNT